MVESSGDNGAERLPSAELDDLREMIRELENLGFHHSPMGTIERTHYDRVVEMEVILAKRESGPRTFVTRTQRQIAHADRMVQRFGVQYDPDAR